MDTVGGGVPRTQVRKRVVVAPDQDAAFDIGHSSRDEDGLPLEPPLTRAEQKACRHVLPLAGNDVAPHAIWRGTSHTLVMSPALRFETWFTEGRSEPSTQCGLLRKEFGDLPDKAACHNDNPVAAEENTATAHAVLDQVADPLQERMGAAGGLRPVSGFRRECDSRGPVGARWQAPGALPRTPEYFAPKNNKARAGYAP